MAGFQIETKYHGLGQCLKNLETLHSTKARSVSRRALTSASSIPLKAAKRMVTQDTGQLKRSLGKRVKTYRGSGTTFVAIGPRPGYKDPQTGRNPVNYAHLVELGTVHSAAKPFLRPSLLQSKDEVISTYQTRVNDGVQREIAKMGV